MTSYETPGRDDPREQGPTPEPELAIEFHKQGPVEPAPDEEPEDPVHEQEEPLGEDVEDDEGQVNLGDVLADPHGLLGGEYPGQRH